MLEQPDVAAGWNGSVELKRDGGIPYLKMTLDLCRPRHPVLSAVTASAGLCMSVLSLSASLAQDATQPYGLDSRSSSSAYLRMPRRETGSPPLLLSQTGAFRNTARLVPAKGLIPYDLNVSFWSDGATKRRWMSLPDNGGKIAFQPAGKWAFPKGTVFVKHFELATDETRPEVKRRLETRRWCATPTAASMARLTSGGPTTTTPISSPQI
jgi:hypothetical protein